jgi:hypothetical protein
MLAACGIGSANVRVQRHVPIANVDDKMKLKSADYSGRISHGCAGIMTESCHNEHDFGCANAVQRCTGCGRGLLRTAAGLSQTF